MTNTALPLGTNGAMTASNIIVPFNNSVDGSTLVITGGVISATGIQSGANVVNVHTVTTGSSYTIGTTDYAILVNKGTGSATTIDLPTSPVLGRIVAGKDAKGDANTNPITVTPASGNIDGSATLIITVAYGGVYLVFGGTNWSSL